MLLLVPITKTQPFCMTARDRPTLVIDELLYKLNDLYLRTDVFADDLFILIRGFDLSTMSELIQNGCNIVERWCTKVGLSINPDKVNLVIFSRKKRRSGYKNPILFGKCIPKM